MDTLDKYLVKEFLNYFFLILSILACLFLGIDFMSKVWGIEKPLMTILELYLYRLPSAIQMFVPVACLMSTLLVLSTMSRQNEVLALFASGTSHFRIISTFIAVVATVSTLSFLTFDSLVPAFSKKHMLLERGLDPGKVDLLNPMPTGFWYRSGDLIYNVGRFNGENSTIEDISVFWIGAQFRLIKKLHALKAHFEDGRWVLEKGNIVLFPVDGPFPSSQLFDRQEGIIPEKPSDFKTWVVQEESMRLKQLRAYINRNHSYGMDTTAQQVSYHERVALIFSPLILVLIGFPFALKPLKNYSAAKSVAFCFLVVFIYLLVFRLSLSVGKGGHIPAVVAGWGPNLIFLGIAALLILSTKRSRA